MRSAASSPSTNSTAGSTSSDTADGAKHQLVAYWATQLRYDVDVVILALRRADVADLNRLARTEMLASGRLGPDALNVGDREYRVGDRVVCLKNRRANGLLNGLRGDGHLDRPRGTVDRDPAPRRHRPLVPGRYLEAGHVDHGYAMTIHKAQGLTADQALVLATDDLYHEAGYTALSRARLDTHIYAVADHFADDPSVDLSHAAQSAPRCRWQRRSIDGSAERSPTSSPSKLGEVRSETEHVLEPPPRATAPVLTATCASAWRRPTGRTERHGGPPHPAMMPAPGCLAFASVVAVPALN